MTAAADTVRYRSADGVAVITINRPDHANSIDPALSVGLGESFERADEDPDVRAVVLTAAGEKIFCAGMDLRAFADLPAGEHFSVDARFVNFAREGRRKPVIAAVNGAAVGGGFELVLGCDMAVAAEHARFGLTEVKVGLVPGGGGTLLSRRVPPAIAYELTLTGDLLPAARARELGLVNAVVPGPQVLDAAVALAAKIAQNAPLAVRAVKASLRAAYEGDAAAGWRTVDELGPAVAASADAIEGARAFNERRAPRWTGR